MNSVNKDTVNYFILHQGSKYIVSTLAKRLKIDSKKVPFEASDYGNTVSSSIPLILENIESEAKTVVLSGFGVGLSWGSVVLNKVS